LAASTDALPAARASDASGRFHRRASQSLRECSRAQSARPAASQPVVARPARPDDAADSRLCESLKRAAAERALRDARQLAAPARELQQALEPAGPAPSRAQRLGKLAERQV